MKKINLLVFFALIMLLNSCKSELDSIQENETPKLEAKFSLLRREQINQHINLLSKLSEIESKGFRATGISGRSVQDSILEGAIIDTDKVLLAERGEKKTYTFPVYRINSGKIENLVLKENTDKTYSGFLIQYDLTKEEKDLFISGQDINIKSRIKIFNIDKLNLSARVQTDVVGCYEITWETGTCTSYLHHAYGDTACTLTGDDAAPKPTVIAIKDICSSYGTQADSPYTNPNFPNDGSSGSYDTAPYTGSEAELIEMNRVFRLKLNTAQLSWYDGHTVLGMDLAKLYNEDNSIPHLNFLRSIIDYMKTSNNAQDTFLYADIIKFIKEEGSYQYTWNLTTETFNDWTDPNRVKPTLKFKNHAKLNNIYNKIKTASNFKQYLQNFEPTFSVAHLMFDLGTVTKPDAIAQTKEPINYWIKITFNQNWDYASTPKIILANAFMHEMVHAEMFRKLLTLAPNNGNFDLNLVLGYLNNNNYVGMFDYYIRFSSNNTDVDHEIMGAHYINIMVNFLKQVYSSHYTDLEYRAVAWLGGGLKGTRAWNLLPQSEKTLLENTYQNNYYLWEL